MAEDYNRYIGKGWTRHEAFADILKRNPPRKDYRKGDIVVLNVKFNYHGHTYCYMSKDDVYKPGDLVEVNVRGESKIVEVESVGYYSEKDYPFEGVGINTVVGPASGDLAEQYRLAIEAEKEREAELDKIREEAKAMLEEARAMKAEVEKEKVEALEMKAKAESQLKELQEARDEINKTKEAVIQANRELIDRALHGLEARMDKVKLKAEQLAAADDTSDHVRETLRKLDDEYIPNTNAMIERYRNIFSEAIPKENIEQLRTDALEAIDSSKDVYENILASLFERDVLELYSEMKALQTMFALAGLTNSDFDVK